MQECRRIYEPEIPKTFLGSTPLLRVMLAVAYFRVRMRMRMSTENTSATMKKVFGTRISEGDIQNILQQFSDSLWAGYASILRDIRYAP